MIGLDIEYAFQDKKEASEIKKGQKAIEIVFLQEERLFCKKKTLKQKEKELTHLLKSFMMFSNVD